MPGNAREYVKGNTTRFIDLPHTSLITMIFIVVEKLQIKNLTKSPKGTIENPGKNVRQKAGLNRNILANKWGLIISQLTYKAERAGTTLVMVDPRKH